MNENISPFVKSHKPWIIRKTIADYLRAKNMFGNLDMETSSDQAASFAKLKKLSDLLFTIKEDLHLVFKRVIDPQNSMYEKSDKYEPNKDETELINNIGLLFHKIMVTRELVYVMEHYATDSEDYTQSKFSFDLYWSKIHYLFEEGVDLIKTGFKRL